MPWTGSSFRKHNSSLSAVQSARATKQANAVLKKTGDEGLAIAVANKNAKKSLHKDPPDHAEGGVITDVEGRPIGEDDGLIAAQKGEYVVKKDAVNKLGTAVLDMINRGDMEKANRLYGKRKGSR